MNQKALLPIVTFLGVFGILYMAGPHTSKQAPPPPQHVQPYPEWPQQPPPPDQPQTPNISVKIPPYLNYSKMVEQLKTWNKEAPDLTEVGTYGKSTKGTELYYIRITNKRNTQAKPKVLIHACIHGNEPLSTTTVMGYIGTMLGTYGTDPKVTELLDTRDIYFVPIVSPDSHPNSRHVDGVDPNRDYPTEQNPGKKSVPPVQAIREFFLQHHFNAVISAHTWGRVYLIPYGDKGDKCPDWDAYQKIIGEMKQLSGYRMMRAFDMYQQGGGINNPPIRTAGMEEMPCPCCYSSVPIYGSEVDWYYRNGAFSIVMELGTHQRIPSDADTKTEFDKTYQGILIFIRDGAVARKAFLVR